MSTSNARSTDIFDLLADVMRARQEEWRDQALCKGLAFPEPGKTRKRAEHLFFPKQSAGGADAQKLCQRCPVRRECYEDWAAQPPASQHYGVWYGTTATEREEARKSGNPLTVAA